MVAKAGTKIERIASSSTTEASWLLWGLPLFLLLSFMLGELSQSKVGHALELQSTAHSLLSRPWTLLTYAVLHTSWRHLLYNQLLLVVSILLWRGRRVREFYILFGIGVLIGALFFLLLPTDSVRVLRGASVGVSVLLIVALCRSAISPWAILILILLMVGVELSGSLETHMPLYSTLLHLSGYLVGGLYLLFRHLGNQYQRKMNKKRAPLVRPPVEEQEATSNAEVLKKVRQSGYASLSDEEKRLLES